MKNRHKPHQRSRIAGLACLSLAALLASACGSEDGPAMGGGDQSAAPLCSALHGSNPRELMTTPVVDVSKVEHSLVFGGMDPGSQAPINFELGFLLNDINVEVRAPADLYIKTIQYQSYSRGFRDGETDYALSFDVCADGDKVAVVEGDLAHVTALASDIQAILDAAEVECRDKTGPEEDAQECTAYLQDEGIVIAAGTVIGTAGGTGQTDYRPGLDFNLLDSRYPNSFVNPDRLGSEEGPGRAFRYGACVYEYFPKSVRDGYVARIGQNGLFRDSAIDPCGTLSIGQAGTAAGVWIRADKVDLEFNDDVFAVIDHLLILGPSPIDPGDKEVISTELSEFNDVDGNPRLMSFVHFGDGDVSVSFYDMEPGPIYCMEAEPLGDDGKAYYYLELGFNGANLMLERLDTDCTAVPQNQRGFSSAVVEFLR